ncbi:hypothetical protein [Cellulomonas endometrii]|uniref:hypothetical protein n=1 Tax=Cellulomonas endometrii TaxID=3036301 RepID=UPI0024AC846D|nr:hypothetical protein [Cellulomonas endometrii]
MDDDELLAFDRSRISDAEEVNFAALLKEHGDQYRSHLLIAKWIDRWREDYEHTAVAPGEWGNGYTRGIAEVAAHLRRGDLLPGGVIYDEQVAPD